MHNISQAEEDGCYTTVGYQGGAQILNLESSSIGEKCFQKGNIQHLFLHGKYSFEEFYIILVSCNNEFM